MTTVMLSSQCRTITITLLPLTATKWPFNETTKIYTKITSIEADDKKGATDRVQQRRSNKILIKAKKQQKENLKACEKTVSNRSKCKSAVAYYRFAEKAIKANQISRFQHLWSTAANHNASAQICSICCSVWPQCNFSFSVKALQCIERALVHLHLGISFLSSLFRLDRDVPTCFCCCQSVLLANANALMDQQKCTMFSARMVPIGSQCTHNLQVLAFKLSATFILSDSLVLHKQVNFKLVS